MIVIAGQWFTQEHRYIVSCCPALHSLGGCADTTLGGGEALSTLFVGKLIPPLLSVWSSDHINILSQFRFCWPGYKKLMCLPCILTLNWKLFAIVSILSSSKGLYAIICSCSSKILSTSFNSFFHSLGSGPSDKMTTIVYEWMQCMSLEGFIFSF